MAACRKMVRIMKLRASSTLLFIVFLITLLACGGSGGTTTGPFTSYSVTQSNAKVTLPPIVGALTNLKVWTSAGEETPSAAGQVSVKVLNNGPQYTEVRNAAGKLVALAFVGNGRTDISIQSTAEAMVYFAVGGPLQRGSIGSQTLVLTNAKNFPGFANVVAAITTTLNAQGFVSAEDPAVKSALDSLRDALIATRKPAETRGPKVEPTKVISGLEINNDVNDQIKITNTAFRRGYMWLSRTGFKDSNGNTHTLADAIAAEPIVMPGRYGGKVDSATGLLTAQYPWEPAAMSPHPVSSDIGDADNEDEIYYDLVTVGVGRTAGDFDKLTNEQFHKWEEIVYWTAYLDFYLPVFANLAVPLNGDALDSLAEFIYEHPGAKSFIGTLPSNMPQVSSLTAQGRFPDAVAHFVSSSQMPAIAEMTADMMVEWASSYGSGLFNNQQDLHNRIHLASQNIGMHNLPAALAGLAPFSDLQNADQANVFKITSEANDFKLQSDNDEVGLTDTVNITALIKNPEPNKTYRYEWTVSNTGFFLQDVDGNSTDESSGGILKSPHKEVFIGNLTTSEGNPTITCKFYIGNTLAGTASTRVSFIEKVKEGTATFIVKTLITPNPNGSATSNSAVAAIAEIPKVTNADHYAIVIEDENGEDLLRKNWAATSNPPVAHPKMWAGKPAHVYWACFDGSFMEGYAATDVVINNAAQTATTFTNNYHNVKMKVTVYFD